MSQSQWEKNILKNEDVVSSIKYCSEMKQVEDRKFSTGFDKLGGHW